MSDAPLGERLQEIEAREKAATPGDWFTELDGIYDAGRTYMVTPTGDSDQDRADAEFIAAAKRDIPFLLSTVRALRAEPTEAGVVDTHTDLPSASPGGQHVQSKPTCSCGWQEASRAQLWKHQAEALRVELAGVVAGSGIFQRAAEIATEQRDAAESEAAALRAERDGLRKALTFAALREANVTRCKRWHPNFLSGDGDEWSGADWSNAMCGEAGETANVVKKLRRIETGTDQGPDDPPPHKLRQMLADEIADTVTYADLLAAHYGIDLAEAIALKFNRVSIRQGFPDRLPAAALHDEGTPDAP